MKALVAYASRYGTTEMCAKQVAKNLNEDVDLLNLKESIDTDLTKYDKVIIGGSINAGKIQKETKKFTERYLEELKTKKLGLFICNMAEGADAKRELYENYPKELLDHASSKEFFGGELKLSEMSAPIRFIIKKIAKTDIDKSLIVQKYINKFITEMNEA